MLINLQPWIKQLDPSSTLIPIRTGLEHHITLPVSWGFEVRSTSTAPRGSISHSMACVRNYFPHCGRAGTECQIFKLGRDNRYYLGEFCVAGQVVAISTLLDVNTV